MTDDDYSPELFRALERINFAYAEIQAERDGYARQATWVCEDGYIVKYTTERVKSGPHDGKFVTMLYKPVGKGARTNKASQYERVYLRAFATRKGAKKRAIEIYAKHSPKWAAR